MVHFNIQSLANKIDIIESELKDFDIICLTETWLDRRISDTDIELSGFKLPYRRDRQGDNHGGICVYVKVVICGKYKNLNKITKIQHISLKFHRLLFLLFSTVCNAK